MPEEIPNGKPAPGTPPADLDMPEEMRGILESLVEHHVTSGAAGTPSAPPATPVGWMLAATASWLLLLWLLLFQPAIARNDQDHTFVPPTELRAASLRFGLWLARHRVDDFRRSAARIPRHAGEAGVDDMAIILEANDGDRYTLIGRDGSIGLRLTSQMSVDSFLGNSLATLTASRAYQQAGIPGITTAR